MTMHDKIKVKGLIYKYAMAHRVSAQQVLVSGF